MVCFGNYNNKCIILFQNSAKLVYKEPSNHVCITYRLNDVDFKIINNAKVFCTNKLAYKQQYNVHVLKKQYNVIITIHRWTIWKL